MFVLVAYILFIICSVLGTGLVIPRTDFRDGECPKFPKTLGARS